MNWRSPWQHDVWVRGVAGARGRLRAETGSDVALIRRLVDEQNGRVLDWLAARDEPCRDILLILPRCVKRPCCSIDRGGSLEPCLECRECDLGDLARIARRFGVHALVAFRSHIAYAMARRVRPQLIIATACEDRLIKALVSVPGSPALLSPLTGMERMCVRAEFDLAWCEDMLRIAAGASEDHEPLSYSQSGT